MIQVIDAGKLLFSAAHYPTPHFVMPEYKNQGDLMSVFWPGPVNSPKKLGMGLTVDV